MSRRGLKPKLDPFVYIPCRTLKSRDSAQDWSRGLNRYRGAELRADAMEKSTPHSAQRARTPSTPPSPGGHGACPGPIWPRPACSATWARCSRMLALQRVRVDRDPGHSDHRRTCYVAGGHGPAVARCGSIRRSRHPDDLLAVYFSGDATSGYALFYVWVGSTSSTSRLARRRDRQRRLGLRQLRASSSPYPVRRGGSATRIVHHFVITAGTLIIARRRCSPTCAPGSSGCCARLTDAARTDAADGPPEPGRPA